MRTAIAGTSIPFPALSIENGRVSMGDNGGSSALGVLVGASLAIVLLVGGFFLITQSGTGGQGPNITIGQSR
jgi:hypothetical protein